MKKIASLIGLVAAAGIAMAGSPNLLQNGSFEETLSPLQGGGFTVWGVFNNFGADDNDEVPAFDGVESAKSFGGFFGPFAQSDSGATQTIQVPDAAGKTFRAAVSAYSSSLDPIEPLDFGAADGNQGHLPLLLLRFANAAGDTLSQPEVRVFDPVVDDFDAWKSSSVEGVAPAGTTQIEVICLLIQFGNNPGALFWDDVSLVEVETASGCNAADLAMPFDVLDLSDINTFVQAFVAQSDAADIDGNDIFDLTDINLFVQAFTSGCP